jgi:hypothetical protein
MAPKVGPTMRSIWPGFLGFVAKFGLSVELAVGLLWAEDPVVLVTAKVVEVVLVTAKVVEVALKSRSFVEGAQVVALWALEFEATEVEIDIVVELLEDIYIMSSGL